MILKLNTSMLYLWAKYLSTDQSNYQNINLEMQLCKINDPNLVSMNAI